MVRQAWRCAVLALLLAGCGSRAEDYLDVFDEQRAAWNEVADTLSKITDAKSMAAAKETLISQLQKHAKLAQRAKALGEPSEAVRRKLEDNAFVLQRAAQRVQEQVAAVRKLPGGEEFLRQFEAEQPSLFPRAP
jgi:hypothetical protein